jgi:hypothetical protein
MIHQPLDASRLQAPTCGVQQKGIIVALSPGFPHWDPGVNSFKGPARKQDEAILVAFSSKHPSRTIF